MLCSFQILESHLGDPIYHLRLWGPVKFLRLDLACFLDLGRKL